MRDHSGFGWLALIVSILLVLLGIATFIWPEAALESFVMVYGVLAVATGIMDIVFYARVERHTGFGPMTALVSGILSVMCGFMLLVYPSAGQWAMTLLFPLWFLTHCISNLTHLNWVRLTARELYDLARSEHPRHHACDAHAAAPRAVGRFHEPDDRLLSHPAGRGRHRAGAQRYGQIISGRKSCYA